MNSYLTAQTASGLDAQVPGAQLTLPGRLPPHGTEPWTLTLDVTQAGMRTFGVYPLAAELTSAGARTGRGTHLPAVLAGKAGGIAR